MCGVTGIILKQTTPIILAKSCHDLDIIKWMLNKPAKHISAMGDLEMVQKKKMPPAGSTARCTDGCAIEREPVLTRPYRLTTITGAVIRIRSCPKIGTNNPMPLWSS